MCSPQEITLKLDDFILDKDMPYWVATLNDGKKVSEDSDRPGLSEHSAWKRLKSYCDTHGLYITSIDIVFRSNRVEIQTGDYDGVFFIKSLLGSFRLSNKPRRFPSKVYYNIGMLKDGKLTVHKYELPVLVLRTSEERQVGDLEDSLTIYHA